MMSVKKIHAYEIIDSKGNPTVEAVMSLDTGLEVTTSVPTSSAQSKYAAVDIRDEDPKRFNALGVTKAVHIINSLIFPKLKGVSVDKQQEIDYWLKKADGTKNLSNLGANTTCIISQLFVKAGAVSKQIPLFVYINELYQKLFTASLPLDKIPTPIFNVINGGKLTNNNLAFQEFGFISSSSVSFSIAYQNAVELFSKLRSVLQYRNANISEGEQGGFTPNFTANIDALEVLNETIIQKDLKLGLDIFLGIDIGAAYFYKDDRYNLREKPHALKSDEYIEYILSLTKDYSLLILEDPIQPEDWANWKKLNSVLSDRIYLTGGDLIESSKDRLITAINEKACSAVVIKPNQVGTITGVFELVDIARKNKMNYIISHRSGETTDSYIADLAVGIQADFVKFGAPSRGERVVKYNRLWTIERDELNSIKT